MREQPTLGRTIRDRRQELGLTQEELADRIGAGVTQSEVSRLERGKIRLPRRERFERLAGALGLPPGELLARSGWAGAERVLHPAPPEPPVSADTIAWSSFSSSWRQSANAGAARRRGTAVAAMRRIDILLFARCWGTQCVRYPLRAKQSSARRVLTVFRFNACLNFHGFCARASCALYARVRTVTARLVQRAV